MGVTLVEFQDGLDEALAEAFRFDDEVIVEEYIPMGREFRVGVLATEDQGLRMLPVVDYHLPADRPIRGDTHLTSAKNLLFSSQLLSPCKIVEAVLTRPLFPFSVDVIFACLVRTSAEKLTEDDKGIMNGFAKFETTCPAVIEAPLWAKLEVGAKRAHVALGCRDYRVVHFTNGLKFG